MTDSDAEEPTERPRPRVVDKRVSARGENDAPAAPPRSVTDPAQPISSASPEQPPGSPDGPQRGRPEWTQEQEEEARQLMEHMTNTPSLEWVANACITLASLADTKLRTGNHADARLPIDALTGILDAAGSGLGDFEQPLRQTLAQLKMTFAQTASGSPGS